MGEVTPNNMNWQWIFAYLLVAYVGSSSQASTPASKSYVAAVVEFAPKTFVNDSKATLESNVALYVQNIEEANRQNADIIVFPEDGVTSYDFPSKRDKLDPWTTIIPAPADKHTPCSQNMTGVSQALKNISCAAQKNKIYVVINIAEKYPCSGDGCPKDKVFYYNTNVVFDRNGTIIARYRKVNLFVEPGFNVTKEPEIVTFDTDFGVKFGTFICFDILFATPSLNLTRDLGITDIAYPTAWFSETPFLTAVQAHSGWAFAEDVNFLAAGYNNPGRGSGGSGIYLGRDGIKKFVMPSKTTSALLVTEVPKKTKKPAAKTTENHDMKHTESNHVHVHDEFRKKREDSQVSNLKLLRDNLNVFETEMLKGNTTKKVCHNSFCCDFSIRVSRIDPKVHYRLAVFNGIRTYVGIRNAGTRACGVIQCSADTIESCGSVLSSTTVFNEISILGTFDDSLKSMIMPSTLNNMIAPLESSEWSFNDHAHETHRHVSMESNKAITNLVTFGLYCRDYNKDNSSAASNIGFYSLSVVIAFLLLRVF